MIEKAGVVFEKNIWSRLQELSTGSIFIVLSFVLYWNIYANKLRVNEFHCQCGRMVEDFTTLVLIVSFLMLGIVVVLSSFYKNVFVIDDSALIIKEIDQINKYVSWNNIELKDNFFGKTNVWDKRNYRIVGSFYSHWDEYKDLTMRINEKIKESLVESESKVVPELLAKEDLVIKPSGIEE